MVAPFFRAAQTVALARAQLEPPSVEHEEEMPFDPARFEWWHQSPERTQVAEVPPDYVPEYLWLQRLQLAKPLIQNRSSSVALRLVDDKVEKEILEERAARADAQNAHLALLRAVTALEMAAENWPEKKRNDEQSRAIRRAEAALKLLKRRSSRGPLDWLTR